MAQNTERSFRDKWNRNAALALDATLDPDSEINKWILGRNGFEDAAALSTYLRGRARILDAGCGNGRVTALIAQNAAPGAHIVGCDLVAAEIARANLARFADVQVVQANLLDDLASLGEFDFIYCQEVLHHTGDPYRAFCNLAARLSPKGEIAIYVYREKAPIREFTDDFVRRQISNLSYDEAMDVCRTLAELGRALSEIRTTVSVPRIDILGIDGGEYPVQRFLYHFFMKCFWNERLTAEENAVINYDWYHPQDASRHTLPEVRTWFADASLDIVHEHVDPYGITVRGKRRS